MKYKQINKQNIWAEKLTNKFFSIASVYNFGSNPTKIIPINDVKMSNHFFVLIFSLIIIGILLYNKQYNIKFPPEVGNCPDYYVSAPNGVCKNES